MLEICNKLRRKRERDLGASGVWVIPVNPDGPKAADFIDNLMTHMGHMVKIAYDNAPDEETREEIRRRAYAAWRGEP